MKDLIKSFAETIYPNANVPGSAGVDTVGKGENSLINIVTNILNAVIGILGLACVIIIIIGGVNYMTSSGDAGKVKKAKDTILYGIIGLVICVLAFAIVNFVIKNIIGTGV